MNFLGKSKMSIFEYLWVRFDLDRSTQGQGARKVANLFLTSPSFVPAMVGHQMKFIIVWQHHASDWHFTTQQKQPSTRLFWPVALPRWASLALAPPCFGQRPLYLDSFGDGSWVSGSKMTKRFQTAGSSSTNDGLANYLWRQHHVGALVDMIWLDRLASPMPRVAGGVESSAASKRETRSKLLFITTLKTTTHLQLQ